MTLTLGYLTPSEYAASVSDRFDGGCAPPNPAPLAAARVRGNRGAAATPKPPAAQPSQQTTNLVEL
jgi:hypothetical protein